MKHYVYILFSYTKDRYYIGSSADTEKRLLRHNAGATPSTIAGWPWKIVYLKEFNSKTEALKLHKCVKLGIKSFIVCEIYPHLMISFPFCFTSGMNNFQRIYECNVPVLPHTMIH